MANVVFQDFVIGGRLTQIILELPARMHESCAIPVQTVLAITSAHICNAAAERERQREREREGDRDLSEFTV